MDGSKDFLLPPSSSGKIWRVCLDLLHTMTCCTHLVYNDPAIGWLLQQPLIPEGAELCLLGCNHRRVLVLIMVSAQ
jgi:hypothetical protein